jgi:hypothetical protein
MLSYLCRLALALKPEDDSCFIVVWLVRPLVTAVLSSRFCFSSAAFAAAAFAVSSAFYFESSSRGMAKHYETCQSTYEV